MIISYFSIIHTGYSIWDGGKIARHAADMEENPEDLEDDFGVDESFEETPTSSPEKTPLARACDFFEKLDIEDAKDLSTDEV